MDQIFKIILIFFINTCNTIKGDPCTSYQVLDSENDHSRSAANVDGSRCDDQLVTGWYRITSKAGERMPTECIIGGGRCGTTFSTWMSGSYPNAGEMANVTACASSYNGDCCTYSHDIQVKNCTDFLVYKLQPVVHCNQAYCFGTELPCPVGQTSDNGFSPGCHYDPCLEVNYKTLDQWQRSVKNTGVNGTICDNMLQPGWYRPISLAGNMMPTQCQEGGFTCGTINTLWMNGSHPAAGDISNVTACASSYNGGCCITSYNIQVKNCGDFYIYNLQNTKGCYQAYCFGTEVLCPPGKTSDNGYTPGCEFDPCHSINYDILSGEERRSSAYALTVNDVAIEDSRLKPGWYRIDSVTGNDIVNYSVPMLQCGTVYPLWMQGHIPDVADKTVDRKVCRSTFNGICDNEYDIKVRNCGSYRTYFLPQLTKDKSAYCFGTLPVPNTTTRPTPPPTTRTTAQQHPEHTNDPQPITEGHREKPYMWVLVCILVIISIVLLMIVILQAYKKRFAPKRSVSCSTIPLSWKTPSCPPSYDEVMQNHYNGEKGEKKMQFLNAEFKTVAPTSTAWSSEI